MSVRRDPKERVILKAATDTFIRYGYRRTKMADIATACAMSRPALYLVFENKEAIFRGVVEMMMEDALARIREELPRHRGLQDKLNHAFEIWTVQPYELISRAPDAEELIDHGKLGFVTDLYERGTTQFASLLTSIIEDHGKTNRLKLDPLQTAELLVASARGLKTTAKDVKDLRRLIRNLMMVCIP